jgi:CHAD domain-containing protein
MPYRIDFDRPLGDEVQRIAFELLANSCELLEKQPDGPHEAIHDTRKNIKRLRALYRLVAAGFPETAATENDRLREIGRSLSHFRDSAALVETTEYLEGETAEKQAKAAIRRLDKILTERRDAIADDEHQIRRTLLEAIEALGAASHAVGDFELPGLRKQAIECLARGWRKTASRAITALGACDHTDTDEPFHELRKRAQDRFMQATLLRAAWSSGMLSIQRQAKALVDLLGHEHDLAMLALHIDEQERLGAADRQRVLDAIEAQRQKLQIRARADGAEIFNEKPKREAEIVALLIRNRS